MFCVCPLNPPILGDFELYFPSILGGQRGAIPKVGSKLNNS
ncbi:hypothetical protein M595_1239 [Lyngbya aestuarii BL J]|uniref:Uncharacterized protein n=1 Tax=Lyngbya aestuarii BL J TaxID=1348334 RepID=U7QLN3_9CYAN|nr:hypothetical protein M595_1239 [Lyngbya aestuarii BL J]